MVNHAYLLALLALLGTLLDGLDGIVARAQNKATAFGGFLDSTIDRLSDSLIIVAFSFGAIVQWEITVSLLIFSFLISYTRSRGELASDNKVLFDVGLIERPQRIIIIFFSLLLFILFPNIGIGGFNLLEICLTILTFLSAYTVLERILYAYQKLHNS